MLKCNKLPSNCWDWWWVTRRFLLMKSYMMLHDLLDTKIILKSDIHYIKYVLSYFPFPLSSHSYHYVWYMPPESPKTQKYLTRRILCYFFPSNVGGFNYKIWQSVKLFVHLRILRSAEISCILLPINFTPIFLHVKGTLISLLVIPNFM